MDGRTMLAVMTLGASGVIIGTRLMLSEESGLQSLGDGSPHWRFLVDPVDGSDNHTRQLPLSAVSVAVLEAEGPLAPDRVHWAMVGGLDQDCPLTATKNLGCRQGEKAVSVSKVRALGDAFVSCELSHHAPSGRLATVLSRARSVRSYGCASRALALVACGALDAHIDVRDRLTLLPDQGRDLFDHGLELIRGGVDPRPGLDEA